MASSSTQFPHFDPDAAYWKVTWECEGNEFFHLYDEGTYGPEAEQIARARVVELKADEEVTNVTIKHRPGRPMSPVQQGSS